MRRCVFLLFSVLFFVHGLEVGAVIRNYEFKFKIPDLKNIRIITPGLSDGIVKLRLYATQPGASVVSTSEAVDSHSYLQMTSIAPLGVTRKITVHISTGSVPSGTILKLSAANCITGDGDCGMASTNISLSSIGQTLIDGIGSCYTGTANTNGYNLTYTWTTDPENLNKIKAFNSYFLQITYTVESN